MYGPLQLFLNFLFFPCKIGQLHPKLPPDGINLHRGFVLADILLGLAFQTAMDYTEKAVILLLINLKGQFVTILSVNKTRD